MSWSGIASALLALVLLLVCLVLQWNAEAYRGQLQSAQTRLVAIKDALQTLPDTDKARILTARGSSRVLHSAGALSGRQDISTVNVSAHAEEEEEPAIFRQLTACCECLSTTTTTTTAKWDWRIIQGGGCLFADVNLTEGNCIHTRNYPNSYPPNDKCMIEIANNPDFVISIEEYDLQDKRRDILRIDGIDWGGTQAPRSPFRPTAGDHILWSSDATLERTGWLMCVRETCATFSCPGGLFPKPNGSAIACAQNKCSEADVLTCCKADCERPDHLLATEYIVTAGCEAGAQHTVADCPIGCAGSSALDGFSPPQKCQANGTFTPPGCRPNGRDFPWITAGSCQRYGPGCVSTIGVGDNYGSEEVCLVYYDLPEGKDVAHFKMILTHMDVQTGDLLLLGGVTFPEGDCRGGKSVICSDGSDLGAPPFRVNARDGLELRGTMSEPLEHPLEPVFWTSDELAQGTGWIMCAVATCREAECPLGYRYNCDADDLWCETHDCSTPADLQTCCVLERQEDADGYGFTMGQATNISWCSQKRTWTGKPDFIGHMRMALEAPAQGETMETRTIALKAAFSSALAQMASVDILDVQVQMAFVNSVLVDVAFRVEQTDTLMDDILDEDYIVAFNTNGNSTVVKAMTYRMMHSPPAATRDAAGFRKYGGSCTDWYPCEIQADCWMEASQSSTCSQMSENKVCRPGSTSGPDFESLYPNVGGFHSWLNQSSEDVGPGRIDEVCCTCGGGSCNRGTYRIFDDMPTLCIACPAGSTSFGSNPRECTECEPGRFTGTIALPECQACPVGRFSDVSGLSECKECSAGTIAAVEGLTSCEPCPAGTTSNSELDACMACSPGFFAPENGTSTCKACPEGRYQAKPSMADCDLCGLGTAAGTTGNTNCEGCDRGRFAGALGLSACHFCEPGHVQPLPGSSACDDCEASYYIPLQGQSECILCEAGTETTEPGKSACDRCKPGFAKAAGALNCSACDAGTFTSQSGLSACWECSLGERTNMPEAATGCTDCEIGRFSAAVASTSCAPCALGTYISKDRATACIECLAGAFSNETGSSSCSNCPPGSYTAVDGRDVCNECSPGQEAIQSGHTQCDECIAGSHAPGAGTSTCSDCSPGWYSPLPGSTACVVCGQGRFAGREGQSECLFCRLGTYADLEGMARCIGCNESLPGEAERWTTMRPPTEEDPARPSGIKPWQELRGAVNRTSCGCRPGTQPITDGTCEDCGEGLICLGMGVLEIEEGYAWDFAYSTWDCEHGIPEACPGGVPGRCMPGRNEEAVACAVCSDNMVPRDDGSCVECKDADALIPASILVIGLAVAAAMYLVFDSPKRKRPKLSLLLIVASLGQAITIIQQLGIISLIRVDWTQPALGVFNAITYISFFDLEVLRPRCLATFDVVRMYSMRVVFVFICLGIVCLSHLLSQLLQHRHNWRTRWPTLWCALGTILLTFFVSILSTMLGPLQCQRHPNGRQTIAWYPSIVCWEGGEQTQMILIGSIAALLPVAFLCASAWAVLNYPRSLLQSKTRFLNRWAFLFFRYNSEAYWYGPVMLIRNGVVAAVPVITSAVLQIFILEVLMLCSLVLLLNVMPWRVDKANQLDAVGHFCLILVAMMASFYVDQDDMEFISVLSVVLILAIPLVLLMVLIFAIIKLFRSMQRPFQFFLCHHKQGAGCFSRLLKTFLLKTDGVTRKVFIDSDDLTNLDTLFDVVAHMTETLVAVCSRNLLLRPWCIGEITTAQRSRVPMVRISMPGVQGPSDEFIVNFLTYVPDITCLTQFSIDLDMIQEALRAFSTTQTLKMPQEIFDSTLAALCKSLVSAKIAEEELCSFQTKCNKRPEVIIIANKMDLEAAATAIILQTLLNPILQIQESCLSLVLGAGEQIPSSVRKGLLLCTNGVFTPHVLNALLECKAKHAVLLPVMSHSNFVCPSVAWMQEQASFTSLSESQRLKVMMLVQAIFTEIAVDFQPSALSGTEATLNIKAHEIAARVFGGMASVTEKVSEMFDWSSKEKSEKRKASSSAVRTASTGTGTGTASSRTSIETEERKPSLLSSGSASSKRPSQASPAAEDVSESITGDEGVDRKAKSSAVSFLELELGAEIAHRGEARKGETTHWML